MQQILVAGQGGIECHCKVMLSRRSAVPSTRKLAQSLLQLICWNRGFGDTAGGDPAGFDILTPALPGPTLGSSGKNQCQEKTDSVSSLASICPLAPFPRGMGVNVVAQTHCRGVHLPRLAGGLAGSQQPPG